IIESLDCRTAAGAKAQARRVEGTIRRVDFVLDWALMRPLGHEVDRATRRSFPRHERSGPLEDFDALEIAGIHHPRRHVLRANLDAVIQRVDQAVGVAAHRKPRGFGGEVTRGYADCALRCFRDATIAAEPERVL